MLQHYWAVQQMWVGLINLSEESWKKGVEALQVAALDPEEMTDATEMKTDIGNWAQAVHETGAQAAQADDWDARAQLYGEILTTLRDVIRSSS